MKKILIAILMIITLGFVGGLAGCGGETPPGPPSVVIQPQGPGETPQDDNITGPNEDEKDWSKHWAYFYRKKKDALFDIDILGLENCKPVKVRIEEIKE